MIMYLRDKDDNNIVDLEVFASPTDGKIHAKLSIVKSWKDSIEFSELKNKVKTVDGVSSIDDALSTVVNTLSKEVKKLSTKVNLRYVED